MQLAISLILSIILSFIYFRPSTTKHNQMAPKTANEWNAVLETLPTAENNGGKIPAFYIAHGSPMWVWPRSVPSRFASMGLGNENEPDGPNVAFLKDFGKFLRRKYDINGIVIFSAHWDTSDPLVTDYGEEENPLLYDYYGFPPELYTEVHFRSKGSNALSRRVFDAFKEANLNARLSPLTENRGYDGRGGRRTPAPGLDHGVFVPLSLMFGHTDKNGPILDIPVVEASFRSDMSAESNEDLGRAVSKLRSEGILVLSGGLMIHTFEDFSAFSESKAKPVFKEWDRAVLSAVEDATSPKDRQKRLRDLLDHPACRLAHPQLDHFIPLYVAAGAGDVEKLDAKVISGLYGVPSIAFGLV